MKNLYKLIGIAALATAMVFSMTACDDGTDPETDPGAPAPQSVTYTSKDSDGNFYTLVVTENISRSARYTAKDGDSFTFIVELPNNNKYSVALTYSGTIESAEDSGTEIEIKITVNGEELTITVEGAEMTVISGKIVDDEGETVVETPETLTSVNEPEEWPVAKRWSKWEADDSTATVDYSVANDGVCTITVGGTAMTTWNVWKVNSAYGYTAAAGKTYTYTFEAWTEGADRTMTVQWYNDWVHNDIHNTGFQDGNPTFTITSEREIYTLKAIEYVNKPIPKSGVQQLEFQCANQLGKFHVNIISITAEEYKPAGQLTITNFRGNPGLRSDKWTMGFAWFSLNGEFRTIMFIQHDDGFSVPASGNSITVNVYNATEWPNKPTTLFTGNVTVDALDMQFELWGPPDLFFRNKVPITFTNGSATINFGTQMKEVDSFDP